MYTHIITRSKQKCFLIGLWPTGSKTKNSKDTNYPLMMLESGQVARVRSDNLRKLKQENKRELVQ